MKQSDAIIEAQKKEISQLLDSNINHGIKLLHKDFKDRMEVLKQEKKASYNASMSGLRDELTKLKADQRTQRENHIKQLKASKIPGAQNLASLIK